MRGRGSISILGCPKLDEVLYVDRLKVNLLTISQICDNDFKVNFSQDLYEKKKKKGKVIFTGHRTVDNCYVINSNSKTSLMCSGLSLMSLNYDTEG